MNATASSLKSSFLMLGLLALAGCNQSATVADRAPAEPADKESVTIMAFNVENLFDNNDDPGKEDRTYLALADNQSREHNAACVEIEVERWREQCRDGYWNYAII